MVAAAVGILVWVVRGAYFVGTASYPAVVQPPSVTLLQFANQGTISAILVHPGQQVKKGQPLATQDSTLLQLRLSYDQATLAADRASLAGIPSSLSARQHSLNLAVQLAQQELASAQARLAAAKTPQEQAAARAAVAADQTKVAAAENALITSASPGSSSATGSAQAAVARDEAAVASDQVALQDATLVAPADGVVAGVGGAAGDLAGPNGVSGGSPVGTQVPSSAGFSLFPPAPQAPSTNSQSGPQALIAFYPKGAWQVVVEVPQSHIFDIKVGEPATVSMTGRSGTLKGAVVSIDEAPIYSNGSANYDVVVRLRRQLKLGLMGLSANVSLRASQ